MEIILLERIERLGQMGDVVNVKNGYARNYLFPQHKALRKTADNLKLFEAKRKEYEAINAKLKAEAEEMAKKMANLSVTIIRQAAERAAENMPIQGTEADLMKRAMINVDAKLPKDAELIMQVHDSLIVECDESISADVADILKSEMESVAPELAIKLAVEVTIGHSWGDL